MRILSLLGCIGFLLVTCERSTDPLTEIITQDEQLQALASDPFHQVQVMYTQIDRDSANRPTFTTYQFNIDDERYFYPASTVKLPSVLIAFEKMKELGIPIDARMEIDSAYSRQSAVRVDSSAANLEPSVAHYAKKILLVSDNDAYNRLYEFIGQDAFNEILEQKGYPKTRITHRLAISRTADENARTNPMRFYIDDGLVYQQPLQIASSVHSAEEPILMGDGYLSGNEIIEGPFDFTAKNFFPLTEQHQMIKALIFPEEFPKYAFDLRPEDRDEVLKYMSILPRESEISIYQNRESYWDSYVKFLMYGSRPEVTIPSNIRIYNKIGVAYGFTTDNAYIIDTEHNIEFFLSATIHTNPNNIYNDGVYDYETVAFPFLERLGNRIYQFELERNRTFKPNFTELLSD
ncbi:MAG: class A beta-lactamase-related serine hydrolase [bacterium]|nr:class A beta-lactamase-related serine hydrolase [bacterium]